MRVTFALLLSIASAPGVYSFQSPAAPVRGAIHGHVVQSKTGEPVKNALVILRRGQEAGTGASTDAAGAFRFDDLDSGPYTLSAERSGFVLDPESERSVVDVKSGPDEAEVTLKLVRTGAISGRVVDSDGEPVTGAGVQIVPVNRKKGAGLASSAGTDDRGEYRAFNIPPGKYRIAVSYTPPPRQIQVKMQRPRTQSGPVPEESYAVTFYPAALDAKLAQTVELEAGADLRGYDVRILKARGVTVRGTVSGPGGAPAGAFVFVALAPVRQTTGVRNYDDVIQDASGAFELKQVLPGTYAISATAPLNDKSLAAHRIVEVGDADVGGIQLTLAPPQTVGGSIVLPEGRAIPAGLLAMLAPRESGDNRAGGLSQPGSDGSFQMRDVPPGDYDVVLASTGPGDDLYVSAIHAGDDDALAGGVHVGAQAVGPLRIVLKANGGAVRAAVRDAHGKPLPDALVKLVPDPPRRAQMALYGDCKTDAAGACTLLGVAPGSYHVFAFAADGQVDFRDPAAAADIEDAGKAILIAESERQGVELTPVPEDQ